MPRSDEISMQQITVCKRTHTNNGGSSSAKSAEREGDKETAANIGIWQDIGGPSEKQYKRSVNQQVSASQGD